MIRIAMLIFTIFIHTICFSQKKQTLISNDDLLFLKTITSAVIDSSRIFPGQAIPSFGENNTGGVLIRPGGRNAYPSFWIRDYAMALETGFITAKEQKHMLLLAASTQCDQTWITKNGSLIPLGAIADHIRIDNSLPIYYPGTYSYEEQGTKQFGTTPPYCDQFYFVHMAYNYVKTTSDVVLLNKDINGTRLIDRLEIAFKVPPVRADNHIVYTNDAFRGVDFGFRDAEEITGDLCFASLLKYRAASEMAELFTMIHQPLKADRYKQIASAIKKALPSTFADEKGMLRASTGKSKQADTWSTAYAVWLNVLEGDDLTKACQALSDAYEKGTLAYKGNIRHILITDDFNEKTAWEISLSRKNEYQNGAYWGTPTGWVCYAIALVNQKNAQQLAKAYIDDLRENDFRKGGEAAAPYECFYPPSHQQNPLYMTTVACPYIVFKAARFRSSAP
ncbi:MAG: hypothetical protein J0I84_09625 [Terrimonas sp.]|nr:hypothetical protein [Terrimonas sp.]OJY80532.1 MAG: hypothetical protein BGP13_18040 [Sphingobacteriales bacterium 40-81]